MLDKLKLDGRKLVTIIDPHTKLDPDYWMYKDTQEKRLNVLNKSASEDY